MADDQTDLEEELATYRAALPSLTDREGQFVLVKGAEVVGVYPTHPAAMKVGYEKFGLQPFMVKRISLNEKVQFVSRVFFPDQRAFPR